MALINSQFLKVVTNDLQNKIDQKLAMFQTLNKDAKVIRLDVGEAVRPLAACVVNAMREAVEQMGDELTFHGRGPVEGYPFLKDPIIKFNYKKYKIKIEEDEIFVSHGTKEDLAAFGDILCKDNRIAVVDPVSQNYIDSNVIGNRAGELNESKHWSHIIYLDCKKENGFMPEFPKLRPDVIYLSYPNNPTGCVMDHETLSKWVKYAIDNDILILFDATYKSFITNKDIPQSIYQIKGAKKVAVEFRSFSKSAAFTGLHCGYTIIPKELTGYSFLADKSANLNTLWKKRQAIKNYTPSYIIQKGAEALYSDEGLKWIKDNISYYMNNAKVLTEALDRANLKYWGGENSPYIWVESPYGSSWKLFDKLLSECEILSLPGEKFGPQGEGFVRLSAFANPTNIILAASRIADLDI
ncbi:MAG: LL-diaminopimelate aminotransferase [Rikenellaceae bacterium]